MFAVLLATTWHTGGQGGKSPWLHIISQKKKDQSSRFNFCGKFWVKEKILMS